MKISNKLIVITITTIIFFMACCYAAYLFVIPQIINSPKNTLKYNQILSEKLGFPTNIEGVQIKTKPNLSFLVYFKNLSAQNAAQEEIITISNFYYRANLLALKSGEINVDYIYTDIEQLRKNKQKSDKKFKLPNLSYLPNINIKKALIKIDEKSNIYVGKIESTKVKGHIETTILAKITTPYAKKAIIVGENGKIIYKKHITLDNLSVGLGKSKLFLSGDKEKLSIKGKDLPVNEIERNFLYYYKYRNPNKKNFIENFDNFAGTMDVNLDYSKSGFNGYCITRDLYARFWTRKIPVKLPKTVFNFNGREIKAQSKGYFGPEPVTTDVVIQGVATPDLHVEGNVYSRFTNNIVKEYMPEITIKNIADAKVKYLVNNGAVDVFYYLDVSKGNDILTDYGSLENTDKFRRISAHTFKNGDPIYLKSFQYDIEGQNILNGTGLFEKENNKYKPKNASIKTNGRISISTIKSFLRNYLTSGTFDANIEYEFKNKILTGMINLYDISHADFLKLDTTKIKVKNNKLSMDTNGTFYNSPISASFEAENNFKAGLLINKIDIHLKKFVLHRGVIDDLPNIESLKNKKKNKKLEYDIEIKQGNLYVDQITHRQFDIDNLEIHGNLKNNIVNFTMPKANYSGGLLSAKGSYNVKTHSSDIQAYASDIDSNKAATRFFKLNNQIQGIAFATAHVITKNKLNNFKADVVFAIDDGFLPKLGSTEFIISKSKGKKSENGKIKKFKFTLSKISNLDFSKPNLFYSNLYGNFTINNEMVTNAKIFSKSDYLSLFIEGDYNIATEHGNLYLWGQHNKTAAKKIRILKIPINLLYKIAFRSEKTADQYADKIEQIPAIKANITDDVSTFRVYVSGNLNSDSKIKVELKNIK